MTLLCFSQTSNICKAEDVKRQYGFKISLPDGSAFKLAQQDQPQLTVVCFLGAECPLVRLYGPILDKMADELKSKNVRFIGLNSNSQDSVDDINEYLKEYKVKFPIVKDYENKIADQYGAIRTPELFVIDQNLELKYKGRIDNQYFPGVIRPKARREDLKIALNELLAGKKVSVPETEATGCFIGKIKKTEVTTKITFAKEVSRILNKHCVECHRTAEIAPFSLTDYVEVQGWGETMLETIDDKRMPPWHANPEHGEFLNSRNMPAEDIKMLREWVHGGMPFGEASELPKPPEFTTGWNLPRKPDQVVEMRTRPFTVPSEGTVEYQYFVVDPGFTEDKWITGAEVIPGNRAVVHHCIVFVRPPDGAEFKGIGWLTGYVPGQKPSLLPPGRARKVLAGSKFVFQMHYTPNGVKQDDITKIGLLFGKQSEITHEVYTIVAINQEFEIPPHAKNFQVEAKVRRLPEKGELLGIIPHMHVRGKSFRLFANKDDKQSILLDVPNYDFNWQHIYELKTPIPIESIDNLEFKAWFDNSEDNPFNPDPSQYVTWGDQTWEEMAVAFFAVSVPVQEGGLSRRKKVKSQEEKDKEQKNVEDFVNHFIKKFDKNQDEIVEYNELPLSLRRFGLRKFDTDHDKKLTRTELKNAARKRMIR